MVRGMSSLTNFEKWAWSSNASSYANVKHMLSFICYWYLQKFCHWNTLCEYFNQPRFCFVAPYKYCLSSEYCFNISLIGKLIIQNHLFKPECCKLIYG